MEGGAHVRGGSGHTAVGARPVRTVPLLAVFQGSCWEGLWHPFLFLSWCCLPFLERERLSSLVSRSVFLFTGADSRACRLSSQVHRTAGPGRLSGVFKTAVHCLLGLTVLAQRRECCGSLSWVCRDCSSCRGLVCGYVGGATLFSGSHFCLRLCKWKRLSHVSCGFLAWGPPGP